MAYNLYCNLFDCRNEWVKYKCSLSSCSNGINWIIMLGFYICCLLTSLFINKLVVIINDKVYEKLLHENTLPGFN